MRLLIIGGAGFIGTNAARHFLKSGYEVTVLDDFSREGSKENWDMVYAEFPNAMLVRADIVTDREVLREEIERSDAVLHLAAQVAVTTSIADPRHDFETNLLGTFNVLEAIRESNTKPALLYASTNKVYGTLSDKAVAEHETRYEFLDAALAVNGIPESRPLDFHSPYGCSKGGADAYVLDYARIYGLKTVVFRQSCIYGTFQFGIEDQGWVAWFTLAAMAGKPLTLYGTGKQVRDVLYIDDLVSLYARTFESIDAVSGRAYNIGGGPKNTLSLIELLAHLKETYGYAPVISHAAARAGDQPIFVADVRSVYADLNWSPQVGAMEGIERMHAWFLENRAVVTRVLGF